MSKSALKKMNFTFNDTKEVDLKLSKSDTIPVVTIKAQLRKAGIPVTGRDQLIVGTKTYTNGEAIDQKELIWEIEVASGPDEITVNIRNGDKTMSFPTKWSADLWSMEEDLKKHNGMAIALQKYGLSYKGKKMASRNLEQFDLDADSVLDFSGSLEQRDLTIKIRRSASNKAHKKSYPSATSITDILVDYEAKTGASMRYLMASYKGEELDSMEDTLESLGMQNGETLVILDEDALSDMQDRLAEFEEMGY